MNKKNTNTGLTNILNETCSTYIGSIGTYIYSTRFKHDNVVNLTS
jgi:hypothetical protein